MDCDSMQRGSNYFEHKMSIDLISMRIKSNGHLGLKRVPLGIYKGKAG